MDLFLCPSDFNPGNFKKRTMEHGRLVVVALDFRATCFMPPPFIEVALKKPRDSFCRTVAGRIAYPHRRSNGVTALLSASSSLVPYGSKPVGKRDFPIPSPHSGWFLSLCSTPTRRQSYNQCQLMFYCTLQPTSTHVPRCLALFSFLRALIQVAAFFSRSYISTYDTAKYAKGFSINGYCPRDGDLTVWLLNRLPDGVNSFLT